MDRGRLEVDRLDADIDQLADAQRAPESQQDQQPITDWVARLAGCIEQLLDLGLCEVLAGAIGLVPLAAALNCRLFSL